MEILLIRHGKTPGNRQRRYVGRTDEGLSEEGIFQLRQRTYPPCDFLVSSPMRRCLETAEVLYGGQQVHICPGLEEMDFGEFEYKNYEELKGKKLRLTRVRVPGKEVCLAHIINPSEACIYQNLGLHIGVHEGEDHTGETIGLIRFTPWEAVVVAADVAVKSAHVDIGFMDRFCGSLILTGGLAQVETAVEEVVRFFHDTLGFRTCEVTR